MKTYKLYLLSLVTTLSIGCNADNVKELSANVVLAELETEAKLYGLTAEDLGIKIIDLERAEKISNKELTHLKKWIREKAAKILEQSKNLMRSLEFDKKIKEAYSRKDTLEIKRLWKEYGVKGPND